MEAIVKGRAPVKSNRERTRARFVPPFAGFVSAREEGRESLRRAIDMTQAPENAPATI